MKPLPKDVIKYKETPRFTEKTVPKGLLTKHNTLPGVWGKIVVESGELEYTILQPQKDTHLLSPEKHGVVEPEVPHHVTLKGEVCFHVEFFK